MVNQFNEITIAETGEVLRTTNPDQLVATGTIEGGAVFSVHIEGGNGTTRVSRSTSRAIREI
ncbi:hypothetical protein GCM10022255_114650 [Dactylosporangium darangshiense]|uniref:Uncharacterized protein n=1 Tax=Dactylosporangium darangshiense TaxID=579108 RepID=A0ABP8DW86_9ACTN